MNCTVRFGNCFIRVSVVYHPCCLMPPCQGELGERQTVNHPDLHFILSPPYINLWQFIVLFVQYSQKFCDISFYMCAWVVWKYPKRFEYNELKIQINGTQFSYREFEQPLQSLEEVHLREGDERVHHAWEDPLLQEPQHDLRPDQDLENPSNQETVVKYLSENTYLKATFRFSHNFLIRFDLGKFTS